MYGGLIDMETPNWPLQAPYTLLLDQEITICED